jgi:hypothetical protein
MIGEHYDHVNYNCAHFVASWYEKHLGIIIPIVNEFELSFIRWMRKHFVKIEKPENGCLVKMSINKGIHVGVYSDYGVYHNYMGGEAKGSVVHWDMGVIKRNYNKVTFWKWSQ